MKQYGDKDTEKRSLLFSSAKRTCCWSVKVSGYVGFGLGMLAFIVGGLFRKVGWQDPLIFGAIICVVSCLVFGSLVNICDGVLFSLRHEKLRAVICFAWALVLLVLVIICCLRTKQ